MRTSSAHAVGEFWHWARRRRRRVRVQGDSMVPTLESGQFVLVELGGRFAAGDIVAAHHPTQDLLLLKRVVAVDPIGLVELGSDNEAVGTDSRSFGSIDAAGVVGRATILLEWPFAALSRHPETSDRDMHR